ncbi:MAG: hypothetical protein ABJA49_03520 [Betaproteobacteria bacterium]
MVWIPSINNEFTSRRAMLTPHPVASHEAAVAPVAQPDGSRRGTRSRQFDPRNALPSSRQHRSQRENEWKRHMQKTTRQSEKHRFSLGNRFFLQ